MMLNGTTGSSGNTTPGERRRSRIKAPFGDEDIPIVFAGTSGREIFHRRLASNRRTALFYDDRMLLHRNDWFADYPECPDRAKAVFDRCESYGLLSRCVLMTAEPALDEILSYAHRSSLVSTVTETASMSDSERKTLASTLDSVYFNEHTNMAARLAAGSVIQAVESVHRGDVRNAFCLIRPPGHHAMEDEACGFCVFNNIALAAHYAMDKLEYDRILIVDWDVHHGQATQYEFYDNSHVLYISIHRYDNQRFWPNLRESNFDFIGGGRGRGFNINIPLNDKNIGDADYLAIFHRLILPVAYEFDPDLVLVSAGFDCAYGCPLGRLDVSPPLFAHLTHKLMSLADGNIVVALEGGYYLDSLAESAAHTISALLGDPIPSLDPLKEVNPSVLKSISDCVSVLRHRWRSLHVFQLTEHTPIPFVNSLPERSWKVKDDGPKLSDVKVPTVEPEEHTHPSEEARIISERLTRIKHSHPVAGCTQASGTCIVYDSRMENHKNEEDRTHPESPHRIRRAYELLDECGLARRCTRVEARYATRSELLRVHTEAYVDRIAMTAGLDQGALDRLADDEESIYFNRHTYDCARLASGSVLAVVDNVCSGHSTNGVAVVRPPGHHASSDCCMGFCFFNNVAVGVRHAQEIYGLERIAVVDWDVHHGNGTGKIFEHDSNVLFISVHRYDDARFFPNSDESSPTTCGLGDGVGRTIHVGWNGRHVRDGEYIAAFTHVILPVLYEFRPQLIFVSAGFDAVRGDRLGGLGVSVECFAHLTHMLLTVSHICSSDTMPPRRLLSEQSADQCSTQNKEFSGGLIIVLEGGYHLTYTAEALCHCVASMLGDCCPRLASGLSPNERGVRAIRQTLLVQEPYWTSIRGYVHAQATLDGADRSEPFYRLRSGAQSTPASTERSEEVLRGQLDDLSISEGVSTAFQSPFAPITSASLSLAPSDPVCVRSLSTSLPTASLATRAVIAPEQETLHELGTDLLATTSAVPAVPSSSSVTLQGAVNSPQLIEEFDHLRIDSPTTSPSARSSLASEVTSTSQHRLTLTNAAGASGPSNVSHTIPGSTSTANRVVTVTTLQDLMNVASIGTEDIHAFFGLESTQQLPERLFAVTPLSWCPHLQSVQVGSNWIPNVNEVCSCCDNLSENWVCLTCCSVCCGRYANSHMMQHFSSSRHPLVLSFADLSSWCYECEAYVHNETLTPAKRAVHRAKFGIDMP